MRVALVSYEYAATRQGGGIATYFRNIAHSLAERGHVVEVIAGGEGTVAHSEPRVHTLNVPREQFAVAALEKFAERNARETFDVMESAEYGADAARIMKEFQNVPLIVKLHTPSFMINEINYSFLTWREKTRFVLGATLRCRWPRPFWAYKPDLDPELELTRNATLVAAPCAAIADIVSDKWRLDRAGIRIVPNLFDPDPALLEVPISTATKVVTFIGKMEVRKGVINFASAIPKLAERMPDLRFRIIGPSLPHPRTGEGMRAVLERMLGKWVKSVDFIEGVPYQDLPRVMAETDICVFPSIWENFPYVCLEAMASGRAVVCSDAGGMAEMVSDGVNGFLIDPHSVDQIVDRITQAATSDGLRWSLGSAARVSVLSRYGSSRIGPIQEQLYEDAIALRGGGSRK